MTEGCMPPGRSLSQGHGHSLKQLRDAEGDRVLLSNHLHHLALSSRAHQRLHTHISNLHTASNQQQGGVAPHPSRRRCVPTTLFDNSVTPNVLMSAGHTGPPVHPKFASEKKAPSHQATRGMRQQQPTPRPPFPRLRANPSAPPLPPRL